MKYEQKIIKVVKFPFCITTQKREIRISFNKHNVFPKALHYLPTNCRNTTISPSAHMNSGKSQHTERNERFLYIIQEQKWNNVNNDLFAQWKTIEKRVLMLHYMLFHWIFFLLGLFLPQSSEFEMGRTVTRETLAYKANHTDNLSHTPKHRNTLHSKTIKPIHPTKRYSNTSEGTNNRQLRYVYLRFAEDIVLK